MEPWLIELIVFLPAILFIGIKTSYDDIKYSKIRNKYIVFSFVYVILAYIILISIYRINNTPIRISYLSDFLINLLIAFSAGISLWLLNMWSAADAKLFIAYSALIPLSVYSNFYIKYFPSILILINSFVPFFIFTFFKIIWPTKLKEKKETLKKIKMEELFMLVLNIFWIRWVINKIFLKLSIEAGFFLSIIVMMGLVILLYRIFKSKIFLFSLAASIIVFVVDYKYILTIMFLKDFLKLFIILVIIFSTLKISPSIFLKKIKVTELREGMLISDIIYKKGDCYRRISITDVEPNKPFTKGEGLVMGAGEQGNSLTKNDIKKLRNLYKNKKLKFCEIRIQQTIPFAPILFLGVLMTLVSQGNFFILLRDSILRFIRQN